MCIRDRLKVASGKLLSAEDKERLISTLDADLTRRLDEEDVLSIAERAIAEHNIEALGRYYENIRFSSIAKHLQLDEEQSEKLLVKMISEGRLKAVIDSRSSLVTFAAEAPRADESEMILNFATRLEEVVSKLP
eukprot:TRINITY_DN5798_c0_g1_i2.p1 TRINITY_DN5798_c0_g1~~TRINITY_DN5798_c0_g1_i2.p1  ORF type:complete len:134 (+),score=48.11 TRINITY_DN5798_c0_g1_i2:64-465(+)